MPRLALTFAGCTVPADIDCPPELLAVLATSGVAVSAAEEGRQSAIVVRFADGRFHLSGPSYVSPFSVEGLDAALGSVMAGLAACKSLAVEPHVLCLHAAAAVVGDRGYLFLAPFGTGKSSLMAELAIRGAAILADDVVLLDVRDGTMQGLRLPPRLRRGSTARARPEMQAWLGERSILQGPRYTYLWPDELAAGPFRLTDIVLLGRVEGEGGSGPVLEQASPGALIPRLLWHNMSRHHAPSAIARMASALVESTRGSILQAADFGHAAELLSNATIRTTAGSGHPPPSSTRRDDLHIIRTDRGAIVSDDQTGRIFEINESAFVILTLLQDVADRQEVRNLLQAIYADVPPAELDAQLAACIRQFADCGLIDFVPPLMSDGVCDVA